jgi:cell division septation protein DedD
MTERDSQTIVLSRQSILLVTAVGVGLLTLCYVLGVQVGKQSAALRTTSSRGSGEDLEELPAPLQDQLKALEAAGFTKPEKTPPKTEPSPKEASKPEPPETPKKPETTKPEPAKPDETKWSVQLVSTPDAAEAERVAAKAKTAGFATTTVKDKTLYKVRLAKPGTRTEMDALEDKLKAKGFKTFTVKVS